MDRSKFDQKSPGSLVPIVTLRGSDWAFLPAELPARWEFEPRLWPLLVSAKEALGTLNGIGQTLAEPQLLLRPLQNREAITSSNIEGTFVTPQQLLLFEQNPNEPSKSSEQNADWVEVHNYGKALEQGCRLLQEMPFCNRLIRAMHETLMTGVRGRNKAPGEFRKHQVQIGSAGRFIPPPSVDVERLMTNLEKYMNQAEDSLDPLVRSFIIHYQFETIHPFLDGNGRIGRAIMALMIYRWHGHTSPWLYLSAYFEKYRDEYMENLYKISTENAWSNWVEFCLRGTIEQANDSISRCQKLNVLKREFHERVAASATNRTHAIIEGLFISPVVRLAAIASKYEVAYPTAKKDVEVLLSAKILEEASQIRPKTFLCPEIIEIAYSE